MAGFDPGPYGHRVPGEPISSEVTLVAPDLTPTSAPTSTPSTPGGPPSVPSALLTRFGELHFLGAGGMGSVYRARDLRLGREVALKFLHREDTETSRSLLREARAQARLEHEHACRVFEVGIESDRPYLVMQYIEGKPLDCERERMTLEEKARVIRQVATALHEAHRLGLVHRDVKPSNIMVERGEDGAYRPYIMDFGLAREVSELGQTTTCIVGTPAFMAPEQACGDIEAMDRRTDVYALGATLYALLAGRAPFEGGNALAVLQDVLLEEPTPLHKLRPEVPEDLEAIVMKCLEKEPGRRYESAKALGEDLQRFLDGEPVKARPASLGYVLLKAAKRNKARVALGAALLVTTSVLGALFVRERQARAETAALSRELGEDVKGMELFLRTAQGLPLHDIEREREIVRRQLHDIEARMESLGRAGEGPGHYALGRGFLALDEPEKALSHLRRAEGSGYAPPELRYAMGLALGKLYRIALQDTKRIQDEARKRGAVAALDARYKAPALSHLRAALGTKLESPAYVEGLIALYEGKNDVALEKAREAFAASPWLHEAKKLEGDARFAEGSRWKRDAAFDWDRMSVELERAAEAYAAAAEIARSDPAVHEAECELWTEQVLASDARPELLRPSFEKAERACNRAIAADSRSRSARVKMALAHNAFAWRAVNGTHNEEPEGILREAILYAEEAARFHKGDAMAQYALGAAYRTEMIHLLNRGLDARATIDRAIAAHEEAIRLDPGFLWPYNEVCSSYTERARSEMLRGVDPGPSVERAVARCDEAIAQDRSFTYPAITKALAHCRRAQHLVERGLSPEAAVEAALASTAAVHDANPLDAANLSAWALWIRASYASDAGADPGPWLEQAGRFVAEMDRLAPSSPNDEIKGLLSMTAALHRVRQGKDPEPALGEARAAFRKLVEAAPWDVDYRIQKARAELIGLRWATARGKADRAPFDAAFAPLSSLLDKERANPHVHQTLAELHELRARWLLASHQRPDRDWTSGLAMADEALSRNPSMARALATKGALLLAQAGAERDVMTRQKLAREARDALGAALRENPLLAEETRAAQKEAEGLLQRPR
ncbi:serine/threonine-protein kinase [Polyangium aurulentum]|uniref:serine/threonine-protein kinase n=1 Tax=Polyangium aurulentum TaxID=2567896 RepID=UPI00146A4745|nr:serine/threonine-protein kinase [Polyangium aurulentum]UQA55542.1 serine/threonine protein kinase [Polyangium aurulentum]